MEIGGARGTPKKNGLELVDPAGKVIGRSFLATMELRLIETDLGDAFSSKKDLVAGG